jgi:hypothetical protein
MIIHALAGIRKQDLEFRQKLPDRWRVLKIAVLIREREVEKGNLAFGLNCAMMRAKSSVNGWCCRISTSLRIDIQAIIPAPCEFYHGKNSG